MVSNNFSSHHYMRTLRRNQISSKLHSFFKKKMARQSGSCLLWEKRVLPVYSCMHTIHYRPIFTGVHKKTICMYVNNPIHVDSVLESRGFAKKNIFSHGTCLFVVFSYDSTLCSRSKISPSLSDENIFSITSITPLNLGPLLQFWVITDRGRHPLHSL